MDVTNLWKIILFRLSSKAIKGFPYIFILLKVSCFFFPETSNQDCKRHNRVSGYSKPASLVIMGVPRGASSCQGGRQSAGCRCSHLASAHNLLYTKEIHTFTEDARMNMSQTSIGFHKEGQNDTDNSEVQKATSEYDLSYGPFSASFSNFTSSFKLSR